MIRKTTRPATVILLALLVAVPAGATTARIVALGEGSAYYEDDRGVMRWYGSLADYPDLLALESGRFSAGNGYKGRHGRKLSGPGAGAHLELGESDRWGTGAIYYHARGDDADPGSLHRGFLGDNVSIMWGQDSGPVTVGLIWREGGETRFEGPNATAVRGRQEAGFGLRLDLAENAYLDVAGEGRRLTDRAEGTNSSGESWATPGHDSWDNYGYRTRAFWGISDRLVLVPLIEYVAEDWATTLFADGGLAEEYSQNTGHLWRLGCGLNFLRDPDNLLVLSADYVDGRTAYSLFDTGEDPTDSFAHRYTAFLGKAAVESRLAHWLVARLSVGYEHLDVSGDFLHPETGSTLLIAGGAGLQLPAFVLDLAVAGREPRGFARYAPTLEQEEDDLWMSVSARWDF